MTRSPCPVSYRRALVSYLFGDLSAQEHQQIRDHLSGCPGCQQELAELQVTLDALPAPEASVSATDVQRLQARLSSRHDISRRWLSPLLTSACALALFAFYFTNPLASRQHPTASGEMLNNLEVIQNLEMLQSIDLLEDLDLLEALESRG